MVSCEKYWEIPSWLVLRKTTSWLALTLVSLRYSSSWPFTRPVSFELMLFFVFYCMCGGSFPWIKTRSPCKVVCSVSEKLSKTSYFGNLENARFVGELGLLVSRERCKRFRQTTVNLFQCRQTLVPERMDSASKWVCLLLRMPNSWL